MSLPDAYSITHEGKLWTYDDKHREERKSADLPKHGKRASQALWDWVFGRKSAGEALEEAGRAGTDAAVEILLPRIEDLKRTGETDRNGFKRVSATPGDLETKIVIPDHASLDRTPGRIPQPGEVETGTCAVDGGVPAYADPSKTPHERHQLAVAEAGRILSEKAACEAAAATQAQFAALDDLAASARDTLSQIRAPKQLKEKWNNAIDTYCRIREGTWLQCEGQDVAGDLQEAAKEIKTFAKSKNQALAGGTYANMVAGKNNQSFKPVGRC